MDQLIGELLKASPSAVACIIIVRMFINHLARREEADDIRDKEKDEQSKQQGVACHLHQLAMLEKIDGMVERNNEHLGENTHVLSNVKDILLKRQ